MVDILKFGKMKFYAGQEFVIAYDQAFLMGYALAAEVALRDVRRLRHYARTMRAMSTIEEWYNPDGCPTVSNQSSLTEIMGDKYAAAIAGLSPLQTVGIIEGVDCWFRVRKRLLVERNRNKKIHLLLGDEKLLRDRKIAAASTPRRKAATSPTIDAVRGYLKNMRETIR